MSEFTKAINIDKIACPFHVFALKKGLEEIGDDEVLKVTTGGISVSNELAAACHSLGHEVEAAEESGKALLFVRKKADSPGKE
ncbi:MAG: hypothetical protein DSZ33_00755 [Gammaproteobacteria bacterium]|nr:MAG: hypothetical protein DSZ33_00755 [Gammaproteobacteria bacterium]